MLGKSHELCYEASRYSYGNTFMYKLSDIGIDWKVASISCEVDEYMMTGYAPCSTTDNRETCSNKVDIFWDFAFTSFGDNTDVTGLDLRVIGI